MLKAKKFTGVIADLSKGLHMLPRPPSAPSPLPRRPASAGAGVRPGDAYLGPSAGKMTVYENLKKLNYDLFRSEEKAKHAQSIAKDMSQKQRIYEDAVLRVKGAYRRTYTLR